VSAAKADAEKIRLLGEAEAQALEAIGISEAERMRMKAAVYKKYGEAAILNITLNALPKVNTLCVFFTNFNMHCFIMIFLPFQIAAEVAAPLARTEEIVLLGGSDATSGEFTRLVGQVPPAVQALTGVDLSKVSQFIFSFLFFPFLINSILINVECYRIQYMLTYALIIFDFNDSTLMTLMI